jgi:alkylhydroperoxidase/carboxymuconolactone decarboxylase family protein YurZ
LDIQDIADELPKRLESWQFKNHFYEMSSMIRPDIETVISAVDELLASDSLHRLLSIILALGNFLNGSRKQIMGFRINSLGKLKDLKSTTGGKNLLEYLVQFIAEREDLKDLLKFSNTIRSVPKAARIEPEKLQKDLSTLSGGLEKTSKFMDVKVIGDQDKFKEKLEQFLDDGNYTFNKICESRDEMTKKVKELAVFFGEDPTKLVDSYASFFGDLAKFIESFNKVRDHVLVLIARKEKADKKFAELQKNHKEPEQKVVAKVKENNRKSIDRRKSINIEQMEAGLRTGALFKLRNK